MGRLHVSAMLMLSSALAGTAGVAHAGGGSSSSGGSSGGCGCVSTSHQVKVPGISVSPPAVTVDLPTLNVVSGGSSSSSASASATATASSNIGVSVTIGASGSSGVSNAQAQANAAYGGGSGGGGGSWSDSGSVTTTIETVRVETPAPPPIETRRVCAAFQTAMKVVAIQASCLDDKSIPHPASQLSPEREIAEGYDGEVYRCIAGARMQYTIADYAGQANFDHGQTLTCQKGEALYHTAAGVLQCRPQKPARDCNERSLLRRFGAGIKIIKVSQAPVCSAWRTEPVQVSAAAY
jgi:hypothetical protein